MRSRIRLASKVAVFLTAALAAAPSTAEPGEVAAAVEHLAESSEAGPVRAERVPVTIPEGQLSPIPADVEIREHVVIAGGSKDAVATPAAPDAGASRLVYSNTLGARVFGLRESLATQRIGDEITTTAVAGCKLDRYVILVSGDRLHDGSESGPFSVEFGLYRTCPGATADPRTIAGTAAQADLPDGGMYAIVVTIPAEFDVPIPPSFYLGVSFSRANTGVVAGAPATVGFSADRLDLPGAACNAWLGGFPADPHASLYVEIYVRGECGESFIGYRNTDHSRSGYSAGARERFADDITLGVSECNLIAYEFAFKDAVVGADLRTRLDDDHPEGDSEVIPGTRCAFIPSGATVDRARCELPEPVLLPETFWVAFRSGSSRDGPVQTCRNALVGDTSSTWMVYDSNRGRWVARMGTEQCWGGFDLTLHCEGAAESGACCDMVLTECVGGPDDGKRCAVNAQCSEPGTCESVCRDLPEMNCSSWWAGYRHLWAAGGHCGPVCVDGPDTGESCSNDSECTLCVDGSRDGSTCCPGAGASCDPADGLCIGGERNGEECCPNGTCSEAGCVGSFCDCGDNAGQPCTRAADCPGWCFPEEPAQCVNTPFNRACGLAVCCEPYVPGPSHPLCRNLTLNQCNAIPPLGGRREWQRGAYCNVGGQRCPISVCGGEDRSDCCTPNAAYCVGGDGHGELCNVFEFPSHCVLGEDGGDCEAASPDAGQLCSLYEPSPCGLDEQGVPYDCVPAFCRGTPGCNDPFCCTDVCTQPGQWFCCSVHWDHQCAEAAAKICGCVYGQNDECWSPNEEWGARLLSVPGGTSMDLLRSTTNVEDPGFCCYAEHPGNHGVASVWYKFVAPASSLELTTCSNMGSDHWDSIIQVYAIDEPDRGRCADQSICSVSEQNCVDDSECLFDEEAACANLMPIACNDDGDPSVCHPSEEPNSHMCVAGLVPGQMYYLSVAAKTEADRGMHSLYVRSPCSGDSPPRCPKAGLTFLDPPSGVVDARRPSATGNVGSNGGIDRIVMSGPSGTADTDCWSICETANIGTANEITHITTDDEDTFTLHLARPITPGALTTVMYTDHSCGSTAGAFASHPANVNGDGVADGADVTAFVGCCLNQQCTVEMSAQKPYRCDIDHNGTIAPADLLREIDLLNGAAFHVPWIDTQKPTVDGICPDHGR